MVEEKAQAEAALAAKEDDGEDSNNDETHQIPKILNFTTHKNDFIWNQHEKQVQKHDLTNSQSLSPDKVNALIALNYDSSQPNKWIFCFCNKMAAIDLIRHFQNSVSEKNDRVKTFNYNDTITSWLFG